MDEEKERQKEVKEKLEDAGLDPDEFDEDPPPHEATDGHSEQPACADPTAKAKRRAGKNSPIFYNRSNFGQSDAKGAKL